MTEDRDDQAEPAVPETLDYRRNIIDPSLPTPGKQMAAGFGFWMLGIAACVALIPLLASARVESPVVIISIPVLAIGAQIALGIHYVRRKRWKSFPSGQLMGMGLTCLLPIGILAVVCGWR